ncbi:hypothetical protein GCM10028857_02030 [Salinarchaeum chitinilyticum]
MNRRTFVQTTVAAAASVGLAGCPGSGTNGGGSSTISADDADVEVAIGRNAPENQAPYEDSVTEVPPQGSDALSLENVIFQRAGERGIVVAGDSTNTGDSALQPVNVVVALYDRDQEGSGVHDSVSARTEYGRLETGETWQWAVTFGDEPPFPIDYFTVQVLANFA